MFKKSKIKKNRLVAVVIPIYKEELNHFECISLVQCTKILAKHPIIIIAPMSLDISKYLQYIPDGVEISVERFADKNFSSLESYNRLMLSVSFYKRFNEYKFILIYQLDAFVFKDELEFWCSQGYDYIGAPWFEGFSNDFGKEFLPFAGNGGFSLRRIRSFKIVLNSFKFFRMEGFKKLFNKLSGMKPGFRKLRRFVFLTLKGFGYHNNTFYAKKTLNEDQFWATVAPQINKNFIVASYEMSLAFSFECQPSRLFELNKRMLPFGCHAWAKYDIEFWRPFFKMYGYKL